MQDESPEDTIAIEHDPELGAGLINYPSNRARLLLIGGGVLLITWLVVTVALLNVEAQTALLITVALIGIVTIGVGWYMAHLWNREVVLYERGFSYREGSLLVFLRYSSIVSIRQRAERMAYFGGLVRRDVFRITLKTDEDETIVLNSVYRHIDDLSLRLEQLIHPHLRRKLERVLANGDGIHFTETLSLSPAGLHENGRDLRWTDYAGYKVESGQLILLEKGRESPWMALPLSDIDNLVILLELLRQRQTDHQAKSEAV